MSVAEGGVCATIKGKQYAPCESIDTLDKYHDCCSGSGSGGNEISFQTLAADQSCFPMGTKIEISGASDPRLNTTWTVTDVGGAIQGTHFDLFTDENLMQTLTENVTAKVVY